MKGTFLVLALIPITSCSNKYPKESVCHPNALAYIQRSTYRSKVAPKELRKVLGSTQQDVQQCFEEHLKDSGKEDFKTCLVVGVNNQGAMEYFSFASQEPGKENSFLKCAAKAALKLSYPQFGKNYILVQSYNFYNGGI